MNQFMETQWDMFQGTLGMRTTLMDALTDADLTFTPGGSAMTLGELCREAGEVDAAYIEALKTFKQSWDVHSGDAELTSSVTKLKAWYQTLEGELKTALSTLTDEDFKTKTVDRDGYPMPLEMQMQAYLQALLIFFGKATIYLKAMNKPLPDSIKAWIW